MRDLVATWRGDEGRLAAGLELTYELDRAVAIRPDDRRCTAAGSGAGSGAGATSRRSLVIAVVALVAASLAATLLLSRRRRTSRSP
jgi:hypothetical protein